MTVRNPSPVRGWRFCLIFGGFMLLSVGCGIGIWVSYTFLIPEYYVSSKGVVHNDSCKFYRELDETRNCLYCGGRH